MKEKLLVVGIRKNKDLIIKVEKHLKKLGGVGWVLLKRLSNKKAIIRWFKKNKSYKKIISY